MTRTRDISLTEMLEILYVIIKQLNSGCERKQMKVGEIVNANLIKKLRGNAIIGKDE